MSITRHDLDAFADHPEWGGWGYLGHEGRTAASDCRLLAAANSMYLDGEALFLWVNSRSARRFMDAGRTAPTDFIGALTKDLPRLHAESYIEVSR